MAAITWPKQGTAALLGTRQDRIDGVDKASGAAKYTYDIAPDRTLIARLLGSSQAHAKIKSIDLSAAKKVPGVVSVHAMKKAAGVEPVLKMATDVVQWEGELVAVVAGETEGAVAEGLKAIKVEYEPLDVFVKEEDLEAAKKAGRTKPLSGEFSKFAKDVDDEDKEIERLLKESAVVVDGYYGIEVITHMCLEPHGSTCEWKGDKLTAHLSTQNVSGTAAQFGGPLGIPASDVTIHCDYIGGGFGSKFSAGEWGIACAHIAKETGRPVKLMLDRDLELKNAGNRPSGFLKVKLGADKDGVVQVWDSHHWSTGGAGGGGTVPVNVVPYVFVPPNVRKKMTAVTTNGGPQQAWRAPNHPQACAMTQTAYDDVARKLGIDSYDVFMRNLKTVSNNKAAVYAEEMKIAAEKIGWKDKWHAHGKGPAKGSIVEGLGMALHTWGGNAVASTCSIKIHPDGGVETFQGSQDLGTGTRTVINMVIAETLGLPMSAVKVNIGSSQYPQANPSGGSITVGSVSEANRRGATEALNKLLEKVATKLGVEADKLEAKKGRIQVIGDADKSMSWKDACALLGVSPIEATGKSPGVVTELSGSQVGGVQMAEVAVDKETGVVKMKKFVAVQDMGLVINPKTAESQIYGAVIMGIAYSLFEERIMDAKTGAFVNAELADYKLPRLGDVGEIVVSIYEPESEYKRGVVGLGEPPVISPGAAISNAVCNALGVRVPVLPMTPKRVLDALKAAT